MLAAGNQHFGQLRIQWKLGHNGTQVCKISVIIQGGQIVEQLQGTHQGLWSRGVHKIEMHQIIDAQLLELQNHSACSKIRKKILEIE